jgi:dTDP-4-amino-4,6-dideoxygalactose transaminase
MKQGVQTLVHYPIPPHQQAAYSSFNGRRYPITERIHDEVLSLKMGPHLHSNDINEVVRYVQDFN